MSDKTQSNTATITFRTEVKKASEWDTLMQGIDDLTPKQVVLRDFKALEAVGDFLIVSIPPASKAGAKPRTQQEFIQDVSTYLTNAKFDAKKKSVKRHPTDASKIVVRRIA